jgi:hypothetical protein
VAERPSGLADHPSANPALLMSGSLVIHLVHAWQPERRRSIRHSVTAALRADRDHQHAVGSVHAQVLGELGCERGRLDAEIGMLRPSRLQELFDDLTAVAAGIGETAPADGGMYASLTPMTAPAAFTRAPPELPGEMAASVCMRSGAQPLLQRMRGVSVLAGSSSAAERWCERR